MAKKIIYIFTVIIALDLLSFLACEHIVYKDMDCSIKSVDIDIVDSNANWNKFTLHIMLQTNSQWHIVKTNLPVNLGFKAYATGVSVNKIYTVPLIKKIEMFLKNSQTNISDNLKTSSGKTIKEYINTLNGGIKIDAKNKCAKYKDYYNSYCYGKDFIFTKKPDCDFGKEEQIILRVELEDGSVFTDTSQVFTLRSCE